MTSAEPEPDGVTVALPAPGYARRLTPGIVHLGAGAFHRSHQAVYLDDLFRAGGPATWGVVGVGTTTADRGLHDALTDQGLRWTVETRQPDGSSDHRVIGTFTDHLLAADAAGEVVSRLADPRVRLATLTITEGGYPVDRGRMEFAPSRTLEEDLRATLPRTAVGLLVRGLERRRAAGSPPFTVMSCDNLPHNGQVARAALVGAADVVDPALAAWIAETVEFPSTVVDRITPVTTPGDVARIRADTGRDDRCPVVAEPFRQWIVERTTRGSVPPLEDVGVQVVDDVAPFETLKLRVLNGGHQAIAWPALLLGHGSVHAAASDPDISALVEAFWRLEVLPTLGAVPGTDVAEYAATVLERFRNSHLPDTVVRLAAHSGDRMPQFVLEATAERLVTGRPTGLTALLVACWWRGLLASEDGSGPLLDGVPADFDGSRGIADFLIGRHLGPVAGDGRFAAQVLRAEEIVRRAGVRTAVRETIAEAVVRSGPPS